MKYVFSILFVLCVFLAPSVQAQIAVADADRLMGQSIAGKDLIEKRRQQITNYEFEFGQKEDSLQTQEQALIAQRGTIPQEVYQTRIVTFRKSLAQAQTEFDRKKARLDRSFSRAIQELQREIGLAVKDVADEKQLQIVAPKKGLLFAEGEIDITDDVMSRLNQRVRSIKLEGE